MSDTPVEINRLQGDLAQLREALRNVEAPEIEEAALRARFRESAQLRAKNAAAKRAGGARRYPLAAAAAVALAVGGALTAVVLRGERTPSPPAIAAAEPAAAPAPSISAFQPLLNSPQLRSSSYSVVRVRIPLAAFAVVPGTAQGGTIEADLLVGEDGLARAIRFNEADALLVSVADQ
jgi:hypothetical protein